uniref:UDP-glucose/GDP-mannose dehydrogenase C-terminal domain-containing protein n=1 Tax=Biomphalaria glabrata TaxID=6526 RepID=A0A2C9LUY9_BIOGL
ESAAIYVSKYLLEEGANIRIYDPKVPEDQIISDLTSAEITDQPEKVHELVSICSDAYEAAEGSHALVICTEWDEFQVSGHVRNRTVKSQVVHMYCITKDNQTCAKQIATLKSFLIQ